MHLKPWYKEPNAGPLGAASARATKAITERALAKSLGRDDLGTAA